VEAAAIARDISRRKELEHALAKAQLKQALELNDAVIQGLATSKMALEMEDHERGLRALTATLENAKKIVTRLFDEAGGMDPGQLVRSEPAVVDEATNNT
jgi:hypothetical protein